MKHRRRYSAMHLLAAAVLAVALAACASIGRPEGGPRDELPPTFVRSNPAPGERNVNRTRLDIFFDENIQLEDAFNKVIVSPVQKNNPSVSSNGRHVVVEFRDTLLPNTTYTIDFADAIKDLNEGNILDGFATDFSTGDSIDSLRISGMVLEARTLEPAQGMLVGVYTNEADSAIRTLPLERIARTNQLGQFTIRNLKPGNYRLFAINDINRDFHWDRTEDVAFFDVAVSPSVQDIEVTDTLRAADGADSLAVRPGIAYLPNDVLLTWFNEGFTSLYLKDSRRPERHKIQIYMSTKSDSLPTLTIASGPHAGRSADSWSRLKYNATRDSLEYWISDSALIASDSLFVAMRYLHTDTTDLISWTTDTLSFIFREPKKNKKKTETSDSLKAAQPVFINFSAVTSSRHELNLPLIFEASEPIDSIAADGVRLSLLEDTLWVPLPDVAFAVDSLNPLMRRRIAREWLPGRKYKLEVDSAAITSMYGRWNNAVKFEFTAKTPDDYSALAFKVTGCDSVPMFVELLNRSDAVVAIAPVIDGTARFEYLASGDYYARLFIDANGNGVWDTGNIDQKLQPEEVYYFPKKLSLKKNWEVEQSWNIFETALDRQKPYAIKKNKPKLKKGEKPPVDPDDEQNQQNGMYGGYGNDRNSGRGNSTGRGGNQRNPFGGIGGGGRRQTGFGF